MTTLPSEQITKKMEESEGDFDIPVFPSYLAVRVHLFVPNHPVEFKKLFCRELVVTDFKFNQLKARK